MRESWAFFDKRYAGEEATDMQEQYKMKNEEPSTQEKTKN
jgi:hypothetical protein